MRYDNGSTVAVEFVADWFQLGGVCVAGLGVAVGVAAGPVVMVSLAAGVVVAVPCLIAAALVALLVQLAWQTLTSRSPEPSYPMAIPVGYPVAIPLGMAAVAMEPQEEDDTVHVPTDVGEMEPGYSPYRELWEGWMADALAKLLRECGVKGARRTWKRSTLIERLLAAGVEPPG